MPMARFLEEEKKQYKIESSVYCGTIIEDNNLNGQYEAIERRKKLYDFSYLADSNVADSVFPIAPKLTPTARPSGILCTVIAITNKIIRFH